MDFDVVIMSNNIVPILGKKEVMQIYGISFPYNLVIFRKLLPLFCEFFILGSKSDLQTF